MFAEVKTTENSEEKHPLDFEENRMIFKQGGTIAGNIRKEIEKKTGQKGRPQFIGESDY